MFRKTVSLTSFFSFILMLVTSVVLYVEPHGRTAYWADWTLLGLSKTQWDNLHLTTGLLFLLAGLLHIWLNWTPIVAYMKNKARQTLSLTPAVFASLVVTLFVTIGTFTGLPPMQQVLDFGTFIKDSLVTTYGNPPYAHAETSSLKQFCTYLQLDLNGAVDALIKAGYTGEITETTTILDIAKTNDVSPNLVYETIRAALVTDPFAAMPPDAPEGSGKMTLADFCTAHGLDIATVQERLAAKGMRSSPDQTLKEIGQPGSMTPPEVYKVIRNQ